MPEITQPRLHHLALTVADIDASVDWYGSIFDVHPVLDVPHPGGVGKILADAEPAAHDRAAPARGQRPATLLRDDDRARPCRLSW